MSRRTYGDWLYADSGLSFAEYMGIEVPRVEYDSGFGRGTLVRYSRFRGGEFLRGEWKGTKKEAKASYKAELKRRRDQVRAWMKSVEPVGTERKQS